MNFHTSPTSIENAITRRIRLPEGASEDAIYNFKCPNTGREFQIRRYDHTYFLEELTPIGNWDDQTQARAFESIFERARESASPNDLKKILLRKLLGQTSIDVPGKSRYFIIRSTGGQSTPITLTTLSECAEKISQALNANTYYRAWLPPVEKTIADEIKETQQSIIYWQEIIQQIDTVETGTVFKGTSGMFGQKLDDDLKRDLLSYFNTPSPELWDRLFSYRIVHHDTLWKAWCDYDPSAPRALREGDRRVWPKIPTGEQLREAIRACVKSNRERAEDMLAQKTAKLKAILKKNQPELSLVDNDIESQRTAENNEGSPFHVGP